MKEEPAKIASSVQNGEDNAIVAYSLLTSRRAICYKWRDSLSWTRGILHKFSCYETWSPTSCSQNSIELQVGKDGQIFPPYLAIEYDEVKLDDANEQGEKFVEVLCCFSCADVQMMQSFLMSTVTGNLRNALSHEHSTTREEHRSMRAFLRVLNELQTTVNYNTNQSRAEKSIFTHQICALETYAGQTDRETG